MSASRCLLIAINDAISDALAKEHGKRIAAGKKAAAAARAAAAGKDRP